MIPDSVQVLAAVIGITFGIYLVTDIVRDVVTRHRFMVEQRRRMRRRA